MSKKWSTELLKQYDLEDIGDQYNEYSPTFQDSIKSRIKKAKDDGFPSPYQKYKGKWYKKLVAFDLTDEEIKTYVNIVNDPIELVNLLVTDHYKHREIKLWDHQIKLLKDYQDNRFNLTIHSRSCGSSLVNTITVLHSLITKQDRGILIIARNDPSVKEFLQGVMGCHASLPYYLKAGIRTASKSSISTDNGSFLKTACTLKDLPIGYTIDLFMAIDAAHMQGWEEFYKFIMPTIGALQNGKIILSSTPNGKEFISEIYMKTMREKKLNSLLGTTSNFDYNLNRVSWRDVPDRTKQWAERTLRDMCNGNYRMFLQEYEALFSDTTEWNRLMNINNICG